MKELFFAVVLFFTADGEPFHQVRFFEPLTQALCQQEAELNLRRYADSLLYRRPGAAYAVAGCSPINVSLPCREEDLYAVYWKSAPKRGNWGRSPRSTSGAQLP